MQECSRSGKATRAWPLVSNTQAGAGLFCHFSPRVEGALAEDLDGRTE